MYMAIAVELVPTREKRDDYKVWYLEIDTQGRVVGIGVKSKKELIASLFENYRQTGTSSWRAFKKGEEHSSPIE
ncbi:MAG: hypothetical protein COU68_03945, partial [Candidatus Pacebacteria bacterium CG10_big_fil_rev_8_21_14_0_10_45_6]